jgi:hypothetical protein
MFGRIDNWTSQSLTDHSRPAKFVFYEQLADYKTFPCQFNTKAGKAVSGIILRFPSFETIVPAMIFLQIRKIATPLPDYLQNKTSTALKHRGWYQTVRGNEL